MQQWIDAFGFFKTGWNTIAVVALLLGLWLILLTEHEPSVWGWAGPSPVMWLLMAIVLPWVPYVQLPWLILLISMSIELYFNRRH